MKLQSTSLRAAEYQTQNALLEVEFRSGAVYRYFEVPAWTYEEFLEAESKGQYFNQRIRNRFRMEKMKPG